MPHADPSVKRAYYKAYYATHRERYLALARKRHLAKPKQLPLKLPTISPQRRVSDAAILAAYAETQSVWKTAQRVGLCGQTVHERLVKLKANHHHNVFTENDILRLRSEYVEHANRGTLDELAASMGRDKTTICGTAKKLGLTDQRRKKSYLAPILSKNTKERWARDGHPRGMKGKRHSAASRAVMSAKQQTVQKNKTPEERAARSLKMLKTKAANGNLINQRPHTTWKAGWREVGGKRCYFRSSWEANYGRYLQWLKFKNQITDWEHEPHTFWFEKIKRGVRCYVPDFRVTETNGSQVYHEVKGWMDPRSKTKLKRMRIHHPKVTVILIDRKGYEAIKRSMKGLIGDWE